MKQGYRKGLAKDLNGKFLIKTMNYVVREPCRFAGIAWMHAGMRDHPRIVGNGG
jgi:hypothetical protein